MTTKFRPVSAPVCAIAVALATAVAASTGAFAQSAPAQTAPSQSAPAQSTNRHTASAVEARIAELRERLQIKPDQMTQWDAVAQAMRENAETIRHLAQERAEARQPHSTMTAVDDLRSYERINEARVDGMKRLLPPFEALYASMSDAQKKNADAVFAQFERPQHHAPKAS